MRPGHHEPEKLQGAIDVILTNAAIGGIKGGVVGLGAAFAAHRCMPLYKTLTIPFKVFIQLGFMITGGCWRVDRELVRYERRIRFQQLHEERQRLEDAASRGEYVDLTGRKVN
ncbi:hypothetical protein TRVA0_034S00232 [Trichomonascus vanleenenianus]|uniref:Rcf3p n=1 Tax=Trichomonascus vanleenenianus TaxID=2268995 RepID=UPI003ECA3C2B